MPLKPDLINPDRQCDLCLGWLPLWYDLNDKENSYYFYNLAANAAGSVSAMMRPVHHKCRPVVITFCEGLQTARATN